MKRLVALLPVLIAFQAGAPPALAWTWPVDGPVLQAFVFGDDPYAAGQHRGIDVAAEAGAPVRAPAAGTVTFAGTVPGGGRTVTIQTADGYSVTLVHLGSIGTARGVAVVEGAAVASVGPSGDAEHDGPYVHVGVRRSADPNGYVDPLELLPSRPAAQPAPAPGPEAPAPGAVTEPVPEAAPEEPAPVDETVPPADRRPEEPPAEPAPVRADPELPAPLTVPAPHRLERVARPPLPTRGAARIAVRAVRSMDADAVPKEAGAAEATASPPAGPVYGSLPAGAGFTAQLEPETQGVSTTPSGGAAGGGARRAAIAALLALAGLAGLSLSRRRRRLGAQLGQLAQAGLADTAPAVLLDRPGRPAEDTARPWPAEQDGLVLDRDLEWVALRESEALADLDRDHDPSQLVQVADDPRGRRLPSAVIAHRGGHRRRAHRSSRGRKPVSFASR